MQGGRYLQKMNSLKNLVPICCEVLSMKYAISHFSLYGLDNDDPGVLVALFSNSTAEKMMHETEQLVKDDHERIG